MNDVTLKSKNKLGLLLMEFLVVVFIFVLFGNHSAQVLAQTKTTPTTTTTPKTPPKTPAATSTANPPQAQEAAGYVARSYDGVDWEGTLTIKNPSGKTDITELITKLINWLLLIIGMVATVVIIISGIMLVFNGGNESTIKTAKTTIIWAVIGLVVSIGAFALVNIVQSLL